VESAVAALREHGWTAAKLPTRTLLLLKRSNVEPFHEDAPRGMEQTGFTQVSDGVDQFRRKLLEQGDQLLFWGLVVNCTPPSRD
jgi:hypothetical protein